MYKPYTISDLNNVEKNGYKVFSTFSCDGGSTQGYKLAGYDVVAICEIDPSLVEIYKANFKPKHIFNTDIREVKEIPSELVDIDVLDGSPPCSVFSMAGSREKAWGKSKTFREGQKKQTLDDLFFSFLDLAKIVKPKVIVAENVKGMVAGKAKWYAKEVLNELNEMGYNAQLFLLNSATANVPQRRERVFFVASRKNLNLPKIVLNPSNEFIYYKDIKTEEGIHKLPVPVDAKMLPFAGPRDRTIADINLRIKGTNSRFNSILIRDDEVPPTLASGSVFINASRGEELTSKELIRIQTFAEDYNFVNNKYSNIKYILGMSVPPRMMEYIANEIKTQWLDKIKRI